MTHLSVEYKKRFVSIVLFQIGKEMWENDYEGTENWENFEKVKFS